MLCSLTFFFFFLNDPAPPEISPLPLPAALPILTYEQLLDVFWASHNPTTPIRQGRDAGDPYRSVIYVHTPEQAAAARASKERLDRSDRFRRPDRKSTRLNSSHANISYAVFCLKK